MKIKFKNYSLEDRKRRVHTDNLMYSTAQDVQDPTLKQSVEQFKQLIKNQNMDQDDADSHLIDYEFQKTVHQNENKYK